MQIFRGFRMGMGLSFTGLHVWWYVHSMCGVGTFSLASRPPVGLQQTARHLQARPPHPVRRAGSNPAVGLSLLLRGGFSDPKKVSMLGDWDDGDVATLMTSSSDHASSARRWLEEQEAAEEERKSKRDTEIEGIDNINENPYATDLSDSVSVEPSNLFETEELLRPLPKKEEVDGNGRPVVAQDSSSVDSALERDLSDVKLEDLRKLCRELGLKVSGRKAQLAKRLTEAQVGSVDWAAKKRGREGDDDAGIVLAADDDGGDRSRGGLRGGGKGGGGRKKRELPTLQREGELRREGYNCIAGVDEAGRGPLAGPVVVAAVVLPDGQGWELKGLDDSKRLSEKKREELYEEITREGSGVRYSIVERSSDEIDRENILACTENGMVMAVEGLEVRPAYVLVDGKRTPPGLKIRCEGIVKGDSKSCSIAAASILAKVTRDRIMRDAHEEFPEYNFGKHKGYATQAHWEAIRDNGPCKLHRLTFEPIKGWVNAGELAPWRLPEGERALLSWSNRRK